MSRDIDERAVPLELRRRACQGLRQVLQLKLQQKRSREEMLNRGIMLPFKSPAAFHKNRQSLEQTQTEDYLKRKIKSRPERSEPIRLHVLEETFAEPWLRARQLQLKRARLADRLNDKISHRPGPMELIHKNILPVPSSIKQAIIETQFPEVTGDNWSCDEDSCYSLSPELPVNQESSLVLLPLSSPPSPARSQLKPNSEHSAQKQKKPKDDRPKIKKFKYHQYIPPDQRGDKEPSPSLDMSYTKIVQQQQLFLQLQIINQQQQNYHAILPAPPKPQSDQQASLSSSTDSITSASSFSTPPASAPSTAPSEQGCRRLLSSAPLGGTTPASLPPNLDKMKVAELKNELKLRSLPVSGTKVDLIERLRTYQGLNGGCNSSSSPTVGGTTGLTAGEEGKPSKTASTATIKNNNTSQNQTSLLTALFSSTSVPLIPSNYSQSSISPGDGSFTCDQFEETMNSPHTQLSPPACSAAPLPTNIKEEQMCSTSAPCNISLKPARLQKHHTVSLAGPNTTTTAPVVTIDKDKVLKEKDKQIEELTKMLRQIQMVVEMLSMQLEHGKSGGHGPETHILVKVKQEAPDKPSPPLSFHHQPFNSTPASFQCETDVAKVSVKLETPEAEECVSEASVQIPDAQGLPKSSTQTLEAQEQINFQIKSEQTSTQTKQLLHLHQSPQLAQPVAIQKHLLKHHHNSQSRQQKPQNRDLKSEDQRNLQKLPQRRKNQSNKKQFKQEHQQMQLKQLKSFLQQQNKQQKMEQMQTAQLQTEKQFKQQQVRQANLNQQTGSAPLTLHLLKRDANQTLVTDINGNHFLIALTSHITDNQRADAPGSKAANHNGLQAVNGGLQVSLYQEQKEVASPPSTREPFNKHQEKSVSQRNTFPSSQKGEVCPSMDDLLSPLSSASIKTPAPSSEYKATGYEEDFIDDFVQTGEMLTTFKHAPDFFQDRQHPNPSIQPCLGIPQPAPFGQSELQSLADTTDEKRHISRGRLEDFLESTTGKPLLGVEPGGALTLIDDLHSEMLCTPSILDPPPSPMNTLDIDAEGEQGPDSMDWLDFNVGEQKGKEAMALDPLGPQAPPSVFSTDFLDSSDLQIQWDSCL
ncbi:myocardin-related transcription factor A-like [Labrus mixtus]|uniref:myocardin-related transcription factor A-like n=1 Tax=Labrus mixtus TaxID=508554 RepID=UPI0029C09631|nr:myocardin-related transcription factor A-like [Labrus mixtus]